ncbi:hypothetical protein I4U23_016187 [Adineta vaga]|nr:hypothetical protein I4U23_016187 [Adineta vaga]
MVVNQVFAIGLFLYISTVHPDHFRGGTITWRPYNTTPSGSSVDVIIRERWSWRRSFFSPGCDDGVIAAKTPLLGNVQDLTCVAGSCTGYWPNMPIPVYCTDYSVPMDVASGEYYKTYTIPLNSGFTLAYTTCCWVFELVVGSYGWWSVAARVNTALRPDGLLNNSPIATNLPVIYKEVNIQHEHVVQMDDFDRDDILKCRWATSATTTINNFDECAGMCNGVPGAVLFQENCTIVFTLVRVNYYAGVTLQIEDFYNSAAVTSNTPMSSVPLQFLFYGYAKPTSCSISPLIIGNRPNRACIGVMPNDNITETVIIQVFCSGQTIVDYVSSVPVGMTKSKISNPSSGIFTIILSWVPIQSQYGPQGVCFGAVDNNSLQSNQWCITFLVGFRSPDIVYPSLVQGSASPIGTVFQNHTLFSFQTTKSVSRPTRNGTYISFYDSTTGSPTLVQQFDCGWQTEVTYTGLTVVIRFPVAPWIPGHSYYVNMDSGVASGSEFCHPESAPITDKTFWVFNIWNPAVSSTTTTTTTPFTTITATTRRTSTTSINTLLTTTGIAITTTTPRTTRTTANATSSPLTTTLSGVTMTGVTSGSTVAVMSVKDFETACMQPITIVNALLLGVMIPIQAAAMYGIFTKLSARFSKAEIDARRRHQRRMKRINRP